MAFSLKMRKGSAINLGETLMQFTDVNFYF